MLILWKLIEGSGFDGKLLEVVGTQVSDMDPLIGSANHLIDWCFVEYTVRGGIETYGFQGYPYWRRVHR